MFRVELPGPKITKASSTRTRGSRSRSRARTSTTSPRRARSGDYREAYDAGHIKVSGDANMQKLIAQVIERHEQRGRDQEGPLRTGGEPGFDPARLARLRAATQLLHRPASAPGPGRDRPVDRRRPGPGRLCRPADLPLAQPQADRRRHRARPHRGALAAPHLGDADDDPPDPGRRRRLVAAAVRARDRALVAAAPGAARHARGEAGQGAASGRAGARGRGTAHPQRGRASGSRPPGSS